MSSRLASTLPSMTARAPLSLRIATTMVHRPQFFAPMGVASFATSKKPKATTKKAKVDKTLKVKGEMAEELESIKQAQADQESAASEKVEKPAEEPIKEAEPVVVSKMFGKVKYRPSRAEFEDELLDSDLNNLAKPFQGGDKSSSSEEAARQAELAIKLAEHQKLIFTEAELADVKKRLKASGEAEYTLYEVPDSLKNAWKRKKMMLYCVNVPAMIGIPCFIEFADLEARYAEKAELIMALLSSVDLIFFFKSYFIYTFMQKLVTKITYNVETDKVTVKQDFGSEFLNTVNAEYNPKELEKYDKKTITGRVGYRSIKKGENHKRLGTEE